MKLPRSPCPVPGCRRTKGPGKLMCWAHWARVPRRLQSAVYRTCAAWLDAARTARSARDPDYMRLRGAYDEAARAAIEAAHGGDA